MKPYERFTFLKKIFISDKATGMANLGALALSLLAEPLQLAYMPIFVQIEPTTKCNLNCGMCMGLLQNPCLAGRQEKAKNMSLSQFRYILNQLPYLRKLSLVGRGEPLLNPALFDMIGYAKDKNITVGFATNATLLNQEICEKIMSSGLDWLNLSLDEADKSSYEAIREGADFEIVIENIKRLVKLKERNSKPKLSIWFLLLKENIESLPRMIFLLKEIGVENLGIQSPHCWGDSRRLKEHREDFAVLNDIDKVKEILGETARIAKKEGIIIEYANMPEMTGKRACRRPWVSPYITVDGFITPCCLNGSDSDVINFGNIFEKPFKEIWNNANYQDFRRKVKGKSRPQVCYGCPGYYETIGVSN